MRVDDALQLADLAALAERINAEHDLAEEQLRAGLAHARAAGLLLLQAKEQVQHGGWLPWVKANCRFSERTARVYMQVATRWDEVMAKRQHAADLSVREGLELLAGPGEEPSAPDTQPTAAQVAETVKQVYGEETAEVVKRAVRIHQRREAREQQNQEARAEAARKGKGTRLTDLADLRVGDFRQVGQVLADESADLLITDPSFDNGSVPLFGDLARLGARVLKPGGSLLTFYGRQALPEVLALMTPHLRYWWQIAVTHRGQKSRLHVKRVFVHHKAICWLVKGRLRPDASTVADLLDSEEPDKVLHPWEQGVTEASYLIEQLTLPGEVVLDPMMGSGTLGVAALALGRRFVGVDIDPGAVAVARGRLADL